MDLILKNAKIVTPSGIVEGDIGILDGKIFKIGSVTEKAKEVRDCTGLFILPGLIDMHVHFRDPGATEKEDFATGSAAAAAGGVTTIMDMPNTLPPTLTCDALEAKRAIARAKSIVNFGLYMGLSHDNLDEIKKAKNIAGVKVYMASTTGDLLIRDHEVLEKLFELGKFSIIHAEDETIIRENMKKYSAENADPSVHSLIRSPRAAFEAVKFVLHCAKKSNARIHITHVSTEGEVEELEKFKREGVSADSTPHHLYLTEAAYKERGNFVKVNPPLRADSDRQALWKGIKNGFIQAVATDHAPHAKSDKEKLYKDAPSGVPGIETLLPLLLNSVHHGDLTLRDVAKITAQNPAQILHIKNKGRIEAGYDADLVIVDMEKSKEVGSEKFFTKCNWSPFSGWRLIGYPVTTLVNGNIVFENGKINDSRKGKEVVFE